MKLMPTPASQKRSVSAMSLFSTLFLSFFLISIQALAQPVNNDPCNAIFINCGSSVSGSTTTATESGIASPTCAGGSLTDVFYTIFAVPGITYEVTVNGDDYDGVLVAYTGPCDGALTELACADDGLASGIAETISFSVSAPQDVLIRTYDWSISDGSFDLSVSCTVPNTTCADAEFINFGGDPVYGNNDGAGPSGPDMDCAFGSDALQNVVWYTFFAPLNGTLIIETTAEPGAVDLFDPQIQILDACGGTVIACDEDGGESLQSRIELGCDEFEQGVQYFLQVDGYFGETGTFKIETSSGPCPAPDNDLCSNATPLSVNLPGNCPANAVEGTTLGSSNEGEFTGSCELANPDVFYTFNSGSFSNFNLGVSGVTATDLVIGIYEACTGEPLNCLVNPSDPVSLELSPETDYLIRVSTNLSFGSPGTFNICLQGVYDCSIFEGNFGDPCDDGDPETINDIIVEGCSCVGEPALPNSNPCTPEEISCGSSVSSNTAEAGESSIDPSCGNTQPDLFYSLEVSTNFEYTVTLSGASFDGVLAIYSGSCTDPTELFCDDQIGNGVPEVITFTPPADGEVLIQVFSWLGTGVFDLSVDCIALVDCPDLGLNIGDPCDDGNPNTFNDVVSPACVCAGVVPPDNDDCADAQMLTVQLPGECPGNLVEGTTENAFGSETDLFQCEPGEPDVFYSFNTGSFSSVTINLEAISALDLVISVYDDCTDPSPIVCSIGTSQSIDIEVMPNTNYILRIHSISGFEGSFNVCVSGNYDCEDLEANIGDSCDDGDPGTINDTVDPFCNCVGVLVPANDECANAQTINVQAPGDCAGNETMGTTINATASESFECETGEPDVFYTFNSGDNTQVTINLNAGTATDLVLSVFNSCTEFSSLLCAFGTSQSETINVDPNTDYILRVHSNLSFGDVGTFTVCVEGVFECPVLEANIGDACDDGDPNTINDTVNADCECVGDPVDGALIVSFDVDCADDYTVELYEPGTANLVTTVTGSVAGSSFTATGLPAGTYDVFVKLNKHLKKGFADITITSGSTSLSGGTFIPGDVTGNNAIGIADFSAFSAAYGTADGDASFNPSADLNCDDAISLPDFSIFSSNFGTDGEEPPL